MWYKELRNLSKRVSATLVHYEIALLDGLSERYGDRSQGPRRVITARTVLRHDITDPPKKGTC